MIKAKKLFLKSQQFSKIQHKLMSPSKNIGEKLTSSSGLKAFATEALAFFRTGCGSFGFYKKDQILLTDV